MSLSNSELGRLPAHLHHHLINSLLFFLDWSRSCSLNKCTLEEVTALPVAATRNCLDVELIGLCAQLSWHFICAHELGYDLILGLLRPGFFWKLFL